MRAGLEGAKNDQKWEIYVSRETRDGYEKRLRAKKGRENLSRARFSIQKKVKNVNIQKEGNGVSCFVNKVAPKRFKSQEKGGRVLKRGLRGRLRQKTRKPPDESAKRLKGKADLS